MIRAFVFVIGLFILWVLFISNFERQRKIIISLGALILVLAVLWIESHGKTPRAGILTTSDIVECGLKAEYTYRSNYNMHFCLQNKHSSATVKRIELRFSANDCQSQVCKELDAVQKQFAITIGPKQTIQSSQSLAFNRLNRAHEGVNWSVKIIGIKAVK